jgi:hypothetical protein
MEVAQEPCAFSHSCCNPGPRQRLPGTALFFCQPHTHLVDMQSHARMPAGEVAGSRAEVSFRSQSGNRRGRMSNWDIGVASAGKWMGG